MAKETQNTGWSKDTPTTRPTKRTNEAVLGDSEPRSKGTTQKRQCTLDSLPQLADDDVDLMHWLPDLGNTARPTVELDADYDYPGLDDDMATLAAMGTFPDNWQLQCSRRPDDALNEGRGCVALDEPDQGIHQKCTFVFGKTKSKDDGQSSGRLAGLAPLQQLSPPTSRLLPSNSSRRPFGNDDQDQSSVLEDTAAQSNWSCSALKDATEQSAERGLEPLESVTETAQPSPSQAKMPSALLLRPYKTFFGLKEFLVAKETLYKNQSKAVFEVFARVSHSYRATAGRVQLFALKDLLDETQPELSGSLVG